MNKNIKKYINEYINPFLITLIIIAIIILTSNLYLNNQKKLTNQNYCLDNFKSLNIDYDKAIITCNKY